MTQSGPRGNYNLKVENLRNIPWTRVFAEGAAIVASILLAFWIQAWWDGKHERADERVILQSLLDDLSAKKDLLLRQRRDRQAVLSSAVKLLQIATDERKELGDDSLDRLLGDLLWYDCVGCWTSAPLNTLMMGGVDSAISNVKLLQKLAALQVSIARVQEDHRNNSNFHYDILTPFLIDNASLAQIAATIRHTPGNPGSLYELPELTISRPIDHSSLLSKLDFQGVLFTKIDLYGELFRPGYSDLERQLDEAISMLEVELSSL